MVNIGEINIMYTVLPWAVARTSYHWALT